MCWWGLQTCNWSYGGGTSGAKNLVIVAEKILNINSLVLKLKHDVMCNRQEFKWGLHNEGHDRPLVKSVIQSYKHHTA